MATTIPNVPVYTGETPAIGQTQPDFNQNTADKLAFDAQVYGVGGAGGALNTTIEAINTASAEIESNAALAEASATNAEQAAAALGYKGEWTPSTDVEIGGIYGYQGSEWRSLTGANVEPVEGDNWHSFKQGYTLYKASGDKSPVENMVLGMPVVTPVGEFCQCENGTIFKKVSDLSGTIDDFIALTDIKSMDFEIGPLTNAFLFGGKIRVPTGEFINDATLSKQTDDFVALAGNGPGKTKLDITGTFIALNGKDNVTVSDMSILGEGKDAGTGQSVIANDPLETKSSERVWIQNCEISGVSGAVFKATGGWNYGMRDVRILGCHTAIEFNESSAFPGWSCSGSRFSNVYILDCEYGIIDNDAWCTTYENLQIELTKNPIVQTAGGSCSFVNLWYENNTNVPILRKPTTFHNGRGIALDDWDIDLFGDGAILSLNAGGDALGVRGGKGDKIFVVKGTGVKSFVSEVDTLGWSFSESFKSSKTNAKDLEVAEGTEIKAKRMTGGVSEGDGEILAVTGYSSRGNTASYDPESNNYAAVASVGINSFTTAAGVGRAFGSCVFSTGTSESGQGSTMVPRWRVDHTGDINPEIDAVYDIGGSSSKRVNDIRVVNTPIVGSSYKIKDDLGSIPQELLDFVLGVEIRAWKHKDGTRTHYGVIITEEFLENIKRVTDIDKFAPLCLDLFTDEDGKSVTRVIHGVEIGELWQIRHDEYQNILLEAMRRKLVNL